MPKHYNSYGFSAGFAAICAAISWFLVQDKACRANLSQSLAGNYNTDHLQMFHYIAIIVGVVIFVLSFFDFAGVLVEIKLLFVAAVIGIFAAGGMMLYATYIAFHVSCKSALATIFSSKNVIEAQDEVGISIMILDLICALLLISAAITFSRVYRY